jgi:hypothetical protein
MSRNFGDRETNLYLGNNGRLPPRSYRSQKTWTFIPGSTMPATGKSPGEKARTFLDGGTPLQVTFQSKKPTICKEITRMGTRRIFGTRFGAPSSGQRCQPFFGSSSTTVSSLGIISGKEASLDHQFSPYVNNRRKPWNISSIDVLSSTGYGTKGLKQCIE